MKMILLMIAENEEKPILMIMNEKKINNEKIILVMKILMSEKLNINIMKKQY
jgi:hypothetical protein